MHSVGLIVFSQIEWVPVWHLTGIVPTAHFVQAVFLNGQSHNFKIFLTLSIPLYAILIPIYVVHDCPSVLGFWVMSVSLSVALSRTLFVGLSLRNATCSRVRKGPFSHATLFKFSHAALMDPLTLLDYATPTLRFLRPLSLTRQYHPVALSRWVRKRCLLSI